MEPFDNEAMTMVANLVNYSLQKKKKKLPIYSDFGKFCFKAYATTVSILLTIIFSSKDKAQAVATLRDNYNVTVHIRIKLQCNHLH